MFDAADRKKLILQIALLLELDQKNRYYCPLYQIIRHHKTRYNMNLRDVRLITLIALFFRNLNPIECAN